MKELNFNGLFCIHHREFNHVKAYQQQQNNHKYAPPHHRIKQDDQCRAEQLQSEVNQRHQPVRHPFLVRQNLVKMETVRLHDILFQPESMQDGHHRIHPVNHQEAEPYQVFRFDDQQQQQRHNPEGDGHATHVTGKASGSFPEVEEEEHDGCNHRVPNQVGMYKVAVRQVHILERSQYRDTVQSCNPVDAIHKVISIHNPDKHDVTNYDGPPGICPEDTSQIKSAAHCQQMEEQTYFLSQSLHIITKAHPRYQRDAREEPQSLRREMKQQEQQRRHPPDNAPTPDGDVVVRAPLVRFVDDVKPIRNPEIKKFCCNQQN